MPNCHRFDHFSNTFGHSSTFYNYICTVIRYNSQCYIYIFFFFSPWTSLQIIPPDTLKLWFGKHFPSSCSANCGAQILLTTLSFHPVLPSLSCEPLAACFGGCLVVEKLLDAVSAFRERPHNILFRSPRTTLSVVTWMDGWMDHSIL